MGKIHVELTAELQAFIRAQRMFFVASAPDDPDGHINLSPKGHDSLLILDPQTLAYLDLTGSGIESVAHIKENGRFVMMFCSFDAAPLILRLHGVAEVIEAGTPEWAKLRPLFPALPGARAIIRLSLRRIADACGWGVPRYEFIESRDDYARVAARLGSEGLERARARANAVSINGLPGLTSAVVEPPNS